MVDPTNPILVEYLTMINPSIKTGKLLNVLVEGSSKNRRRSNKKVQEIPPHVSQEKVSKKSSKDANISKKNDPTQIVTKLVEKEKEKVVQETEVVPSKYGVFKGLMKMAHLPIERSKRFSPTLQYKQ